MSKFELGNIVATKGVYDKYASDKTFYYFVATSLTRYAGCDWGDTCEDDKKLNDSSVKEGERILAVYNYDEETTIWIITEWDRSVTTILFPYEY